MAQKGHVHNNNCFAKMKKKMKKKIEIIISYRSDYNTHSNYMENPFKQIQSYTK